MLQPVHWHTAALQIPPEGFSNCALNRNTPMSSYSTVTSSQKKTTTAQPSWDSRKEPVPALLTLVLLLLFSGSQQGLLPLCRRRHAGPVPPGPASPLSRLSRRRLAAGGRCRPGARPPTAANGPGASRAGHVPGRAQLSVRLRAPALPRARGWPRPLPPSPSPPTAVPRRVSHLRGERPLGAGGGWGGRAFWGVNG